MKTDNGSIIYSPSDLVTFVKSPYASWMDRKYPLDRTSLTPDEDDPLMTVLARRGDEHENTYLNELKSGGRDVCEISRTSKFRFEDTLAAIQAGREVIFQANLKSGQFTGFADFLFHVKLPDGSFGYSVWDTKLSRHPKPYFIIQLCCYAQMLEAMTGKLPETMGLVLGDGEKIEYRVNDFRFYYQRVADAFSKSMRDWTPGNPPVPESSADHGPLPVIPAREPGSTPFIALPSKPS